VWTTTATRPRSSATRSTSCSDKEAARDGDIRVVDESGEDYLFSADRFVVIDIPEAVKASLLKAS
jgi:hypothetical protein